MEMNRKCHHVLAVPYPTQGHINPMLQFSKRLVSKGLKTTLAITKFHFNSTNPPPSINSVSIDTISDGFDDSGFLQAPDCSSYLHTFQIVGSKTIRDLIHRHQTSGHPIDCVVYDSFIPWVFDVVKPLGIKAASFFTQPCAVNFLYYNVSIGKLPVSPSTPVNSIPGLPLLGADDLPPFVSEPEAYVPYRDMVFGQFRHVVEADFVFVNTFYELEEEVVEEMSKYSPLITIGPTIPSFYLLDKRVVESDYDYGLNLYESDPSTTMQWISTKPKGSVVYVSFGSLSNLGERQMEELSFGLQASGFDFLWVIRATEMGKLPKSFVNNSEKGLVVGWCPQLEVLANDAVGCFFSHAGWNSTMEALSLGVPMVAMPQWTDQPMNAKLAEDVWKVAIRVRVEEKGGIVGRDEVVRCVREVMDGESGKELKRNALRWRDVAKKAINEDGSSDRNIDTFVNKLTEC